jgi:uracil-DNA glycosylase
MPAQLTRTPLPIVIDRLKATYPDARYELNWENPLQLLVATILAAQATDQRINEITPGLFAKYPDARAFAEADRAELEQDLRPTGFYRNKAKAVQEACQALMERFNGEVPRTMYEMLTLPGVARKTANVVLTNAFRIPSGVIVDTHVARVSQRLGLTEQTRPEKIEADLMRSMPKDEWVHFGPAMVLLGRYTCTAHNPQCPQCVMNDICPKRGVDAPDAPADPPPAKKGGSAKANPAKKPGKGPAPKSKPEPAPKPAAGLEGQLPADWQAVLAGEFNKPYFRKLQEFVAAERRAHTVFPPEEDVFNAFKFTPYQKVKVLLLGQDPYHDDGQAHGMCFSVRPGVKPPPSLVNIFKEMQSDVGCRIPNHGHLTRWAQQGVMLLNAVLTVRAHQANSHKEKGWETFTDAVIRALSDRPDPVVFLLWGAHAQKKQWLIDGNRHRILLAAHPSPLSAKHFFGSKPFSKANQALAELGQTPIDWQLPDLNGGEGEAKTPSARPAQLPASPASAKPTPTSVGETAVNPPNPLPALLDTTLTYLLSLRHTGQLSPGWLTALAGEFQKPYFRKLEKFIAAERQARKVFPSEDEVFTALQLTPFEQVRVVIVGDEPSASEGHSHGLAFSVRPGVEPTPALRNVFKELRNDLGCWIPGTGCLIPWAKQGILLLNSVLTVPAGEPGGHRGKGWETFTDGVVRALNGRPEPVVFLLCGAPAHRKAHLIDEDRHAVLTLPDPADGDFLGTRPFSTANNTLELKGQPAIYWQLFAV